MDKDYQALRLLLARHPYGRALRLWGEAMLLQKDPAAVKGARRRALHRVLGPLGLWPAAVPAPTALPWGMRRSEPPSKAPGTKGHPSPEEAEGHTRELPELIFEQMRLKPITLEIGLDLVCLVDPSLGGRFMETLMPLRERLALDLGMVFPGIGVLDNLKQAPTHYRILVHGKVVGEGSALIGHLLFLDPQTAAGQVAGTPGMDPISGEAALWIKGGAIEQVRRLAPGARLMSPDEVILAHLEGVLHKHAHRLLCGEGLGKMLQHLVDRRLADELLSRFMTFNELRFVLQKLLAAGHSLRDLDAILEILYGHYLEQLSRRPERFNGGSMANGPMFSPDHLAEVVCRGLGLPSSTLASPFMRKQTQRLDGTVFP